MSELAKQHCKPCEGGVEPLSREQSEDYLAKINKSWSMTEDGLEIRRDFEFTGFYKTMGFVNAVAWIAQTEGHHPDMEVGYRHCLIRYTTHAINGLSANDFICAAKIDALLK